MRIVGGHNLGGPRPGGTSAWLLGGLPLGRCSAPPLAASGWHRAASPSRLIPIVVGRLIFMFFMFFHKEPALPRDVVVMPRIQNRFGLVDQVIQGFELLVNAGETHI